MTVVAAPSASTVTGVTLSDDAELDTSRRAVVFPEPHPMEDAAATPASKTMIAPRMNFSLP
jgi:hypothetical protein